MALSEIWLKIFYLNDLYSEDQCTDMLFEEEKKNIIYEIALV